MIFVGLVFVVNSLDSLIRLYATNLGWGKDKLGNTYYPIQFALVCAYFFTPFRIEWVGLVVLGVYSVVFAVIARNTVHVR